MSRTDLIADGFTVIRNAIMAKKDSVEIPASGTLKSIFEILKKEHYIDNFKCIEDNKQGRIKVYLKYLASKSAIRNIKRISRPGLRIYVKSEKIPSVLRGRGISIVSTPKGVMTGDEAKKLHQGGELLAFIW